MQPCTGLLPYLEAAPLAGKGVEDRVPPTPSHLALTSVKKLSMAAATWRAPVKLQAAPQQATMCCKGVMMRMMRMVLVISLQAAGEAADPQALPSPAAAISPQFSSCPPSSPAHASRRPQPFVSPASGGCTRNHMELGNPQQGEQSVQRGELRAPSSTQKVSPFRVNGACFQGSVQRLRSLDLGGKKRKITFLPQQPASLGRSTQKVKVP